MVRTMNKQPKIPSAQWTVECIQCGKTFKRPIGKPELNPHKMPDGITQCPNRVGRPLI